MPQDASEQKITCSPSIDEDSASDYFLILSSLKWRQLYCAEVDFTTFGLQAYVPRHDIQTRGFIDLLAVNNQREIALVECDLVLVPLAMFIFIALDF
jgi:hypothetical protein